MWHRATRAGFLKVKFCLSNFHRIPWTLVLLVSMEKALIIGHSFVRRLKAHMHGHRSNLGFNSDILEVECVHRGGAHVPFICSPEVTTALAKRPRLVMTQLGSNDLDQKEVDLDHLVDYLRQWTEFTRDMYGTHTIVFC